MVQQHQSEERDGQAIDEQVLTFRYLSTIRASRLKEAMSLGRLTGNCPLLLPSMFAYQALGSQCLKSCASFGEGSGLGSDVRTVNHFV